MKKNIIIKIVSLIFMSIILSLTCIACNNSNSKTKNTLNQETSNTRIHVNTEIEKLYKKNTENLILITPTQLENIVTQHDNEEIFIYFGRVTCPYCRTFVATLKKEVNTKIPVYYIDTEDTDIDKTIKNVRDKYGIEQVPGLIKIENGRHSNFNMNTGNLSEFLSTNQF